MNRDARRFDLIVHMRTSASALMEAQSSKDHSDAYERLSALIDQADDFIKSIIYDE